MFALIGLLVVVGLGVLGYFYFKSPTVKADVNTVVSDVKTDVK